MTPKAAKISSRPLVREAEKVKLVAPEFGRKILGAAPLKLNYQKVDRLITPYKSEVPNPEPSSPEIGQYELNLMQVVESQIHAARETTVIARAVEVIGDRSTALRWLGTPVQALNYATPISLLHDAMGFQEVLTILGRLEHGVL